MTWLLFWVSALACYRITLMISRELGPFKVFKRLRNVAFCTKLLTCPYCVSVYVASLISLGLWFTGVNLDWFQWVILSLALSSITVIADRTFTSDFQT